MYQGTPRHDAWRTVSVKTFLRKPGFMPESVRLYGTSALPAMMEAKFWQSSA
jgi:hypothetical protein